MTGTGVGVVMVAETAGLDNGPADLWATDVMETRTVAALQGTTATLDAPLSAVPQDYAAYVYQTFSKRAIKVRIKAIEKSIGDQHYKITAVDYSAESYVLPAPAAGLSYTPPAVTAGSGSNPSAAAQAYFSVAYSQGTQAVAHTTPGGYNYTQDTPYYQVTDIQVNNPGTNYTASSVAKLSSGFDEIDPVSGTETKDVDETVVLPLGPTGGITRVTGWDTSKRWNAVPSVAVTK